MENSKVIQWFPGHMAKAKREIIESLNKVDVVFELYDSRIPFSSKNPMVDEIVKNKPRVVLLNKANIADKKTTKLWIDYYKNKGILALDIDSITGYNINKIIDYANKALKEVFEKREKKGIRSKQIKALIIGIPNVGKSTLINKLAKRKATNVGDKPGVTKAQSWIKVTDDLFLLDTPGVLWPKFEDQMVGLRLAICGSIKDDILDTIDIAYGAIELIKYRYPELLKERYKLAELLSNEEILADIAKNRGCLLKAGEPDLLRAATLFLNDIRNIRIGAMSYEEPEGC